MYDFGIEEKEFQLMLDVATEKMEMNEVTFGLISDTMRRVRDSGKLDDYTRTQVGLLCNDFSVAIEKLNNKTEYEVAMEEMSGGMMALIAAAIGVVLGIIIKIVSIFGGGGSSGGSGGGSSATKEEHEEVNSTNLDVSKLVLELNDSINNSSNSEINKIAKEATEIFTNETNYKKMTSVLFYIGYTENEHYKNYITNTQYEYIAPASIVLGVIKHLWDKIYINNLNEETIEKTLSEIKTDNIVRYENNKLVIDLSNAKADVTSFRTLYDETFKKREDEQEGTNIMETNNNINQKLISNGVVKLRIDRANILKTSNSLTKTISDIKGLQSKIEESKNINVNSEFIGRIITALKEGINDVLIIYSSIGNMFSIFENLGNSVEEHILTVVKYCKFCVDKIETLIENEKDTSIKNNLEKDLVIIKDKRNKILELTNQKKGIIGKNLAKKFTFASSVKTAISSKK